MVIIEPSLLSANFAFLGDQAREAETAGAQVLQVDVMDGTFVPNLAFGPGTVKALRPLVKLRLDAHLMVQEPDRFFSAFVDAGADRIIVHLEACSHLHRTLESLRALGVEVGVALNPGTPIYHLEEVLDLVDLIQIMTVNPGFGGQKFLHSQLEKIKRLKAYLSARGLDIPIAVDGGIDSVTAPMVVAAGATVLVAGSSVYNQQFSVSDNIQKLQNSLNQK